MKHVTINIQSLVNKLVINNTGIESAGELRSKVTELLLKAVNDSQAMMEEPKFNPTSKWHSLMGWALEHNDAYLYKRASEQVYGSN